MRGNTTLLCAALALCAAWILVLYAEILFFSAALSRVPERSVSIDGFVYTVAHGRVSGERGVPDRKTKERALRLAYSAETAARSPLLALPGTDPDSLLYAVSGLSELSRSLASLQKRARDKAFVEHTLYPIAFLEAAAEAERAREFFLTEPSETRERAYYDALRTEATAYLNDIGRFREGVRNVVSDNAGAYVAAGKIVSKESFLEALGTLESGMLGTMERLEARERCIRGAFLSCDIRALRIPRIKENEVAAISAAKVETARENQETLLPLEKERGTQSLVLLEKSACLRDTDTPLFALSREIGEAPNAPPRRRGYYIGDIRFVDTATHENLPFYRDVRKRNI